ncbi:MAG: cupin domain-containing protein [Comamonadaceae bacterium]|nr:MAG: cupin domain-containing protein [Comamonadaceae bacterium]
MTAVAEKTYEMQIKDVTPEQMESRVARFDQLKYPPDRYPDSKLPGHVRKNYLVVGKGLIGKGFNDPMSAIPVDEGFQMSYVTCEPGNGPRLHNHDTNETFVAIKGTWRVIWGLEEEHSVDLAEMDVCSMPAYTPRRFINLTPGEGRTEGLLLTVQPGDIAKCEFM